MHQTDCEPVLDKIGIEYSPEDKYNTSIVTKDAKNVKIKNTKNIVITDAKKLKLLNV
jgi:hypothetical protein